MYHSVPIVDAERVEATDPGVFDDDVKPPEPFDRMRHKRLEIGAPRDVGDARLRLSAGSVQFGRQCGKGIHATSAENDHLTPAGERPSRCRLALLAPVIATTKFASPQPFFWAKPESRSDFLARRSGDVATRKCP